MILFTLKERIYTFAYKNIPGTRLLLVPQLWRHKRNQLGLHAGPGLSLTIEFESLRVIFNFLFSVHQLACILIGAVGGTLGELLWLGLWLPTALLLLLVRVRVHLLRFGLHVKLLGNVLRVRLAIENARFPGSEFRVQSALG